MKQHYLVAVLVFLCPFLLQAAEIQSTNPQLPESLNTSQSIVKQSTAQEILLEIESKPVKIEDLTDNAAPEMWGVAFTYRTAEIPYDTNKESVSDIVPLLFYEKGRFFWHGIEAGYTFADYEQWNVSLLGRYRFYDIPAEYQNTTRGNAYDFGFRYRKHQAEDLDLDLEVMNDLHGRTHVNLASRFYRERGNWNLMPYVNLRWKSSEFNNHYYGLDVDSPGSGFDLTVGSSVQYHVYENLYLLGRAAITMFDSDTYHTSTVNTPNQTEIFLGFGFFEDTKNKQTKPSSLKSKPYIRVAYGSATPSNIGEVVKGNKEKDVYGNTLTSVFYGAPVSDTLFSIDLPIYFTVGYVQHQRSAVQRSFPEYVIGIKGYYTVNWPTRWRIGIAEGLSYTTEITYIEKTEMDSKGYRASNLLNYLDFTVDVDLGDLFESKALKNLWLGYGIHHRSGIFETSSAFGRIKGGSNYTSLYLQYHW